MKIGDAVTYGIASPKKGIGVIVGFNKKGEGGKEFIKILCDNGEIRTYMAWEVEVVSESR